MPSAAVVVRAPAQGRNRIAGSKRKMNLPMSVARINGTEVAKMPHRNRLRPWVFSPLTNPGPAEMPTTAMNTFRPTEFMNHTVEDGMRPKKGLVDRSQPNTRPELRAPPAGASDPPCGGRDPPEEGPRRRQPADPGARDEGPARGGQGQRHASTFQT